MIKWISKSAILTFLMIILFTLPALASDVHTGNPKVIRVAYPIQQGLTMVDEEGKYYGYTYDYLMEISQYTGWKYEIVLLPGDENAQAEAAVAMLKNGEVDLIGGLNYNTALTEYFSYPGYSYGTNYSGIFVPENSRFTESTLYTIGSIRVGVYSRALKRNEKLDQFAEMNGLSVEQVIVDSVDEYKSLISKGKVDSLLSTDLSMQDHAGMHAIAHFSPSPFYFATPKGNIDIVRQLDYAISAIDKVNPNFGVQTYNKYFTNEASSLYITEEENHYIKNHGLLEVAMYSNKPPYQYVDSKTGEPAGITVEILDLISQTTGFTFHYNLVSSYDEYIKLIGDGIVDISADALLNYQDVEELDSTLTLPWHSLPLYLISREGFVQKDGGSYAVPHFLKNVIPALDNVIYFDTVEECMQAVQRKAVDYCYADEYSSQYLFNSGSYNDLKYMSQPDSTTQKLCFGVRDTKEFSLLSLINKCITYMPQDKVEEIIYRNTYAPQKLSFGMLVKKNRVSLLALAMTVMGMVFAFYIYVKNKEQKRIAFENQRYDTLSSMANEYFYEYYVSKDLLVLSDKCADYFSCDVKIERFSKCLAYKTAEERNGIWAFGDYVTSNEEGSKEILCRMPDHRQQWFKVISSVLFNKDRQIYAIGKITNIQEMKSRQLDLERTASKDGLTGIYNIATVKRLIQERLERRIVTASTQAFLILDIDNFKQVNDKYGHYSGDDVLIQIAELMTDIFYPNLVGRLGGDEFIIFTENMDLPEIEERCSTLRQSLAERTKSMLGAEFTVSLGITIVQKGQEFDALYHEADKALYQTKAKSKNGYTVYDKSNPL